MCTVKVRDRRVKCLTGSRPLEGFLAGNIFYKLLQFQNSVLVESPVNLSGSSQIRTDLPRTSIALWTVTHASPSWPYINLLINRPIIDRSIISNRSVGLFLNHVPPPRFLPVYRLTRCDGLFNGSTIPCTVTKKGTEKTSTI